MKSYIYILFYTLAFNVAGQTDSLHKAKWSEPVNIGSMIGSEPFEFEPIRDKHAPIFFSSRNRHFGLWKDTTNSVFHSSLFRIDTSQLVMLVPQLIDEPKAFIFSHSISGDCLFYFSEFNQGYHYLATWVNDHYVRFSKNANPIHFIAVSTEDLTLREKAILKPIKRSFMQWGARAPKPYASYKCGAEFEIDDPESLQDPDIFIFDAEKDMEDDFDTK